MNEADEREPVAASADEERRGRRRLRRLVAAAVAVLVLSILALSVASALGVRRSLEDGRSALASGRASFVEGDTVGAGAAFARAGEAFRTAARRARSPWLSLVGAIPFLGRTPDTVRAIADAGVGTAEAANGLAVAIADLPGGLGALAPTAGTFPIDRVTGLTGAVERAARLTSEALRSLEGARSGFVLPVVASARDAALTQLEDLDRQLRAGALILRGLPAFLGADGPRRYFLGASNPAELRGSGGLIGAYAILTIDRGRISVSDFRATESLPRLSVGDVPAPSAEYSRNFDFFRNGVGFWLNINMSPDFPLDARAIWLAFRQATGESLDGVIVADPYALQALMRVTGPVEVAKTGLRVTERDIVPFVTNRAYALFQTNAERKAVLGRVAGSVLLSFLEQTGDPRSRLRAAQAAFGDGHVKVWSADPSMERGLALTTTGAAFRPPGTDAISVVTNSFSGTKLDFYQRRSITYDVQLGPQEAATATLVADLANDSPTSGFPPYVIGPYKSFSRVPGENVALVHLYCDRGCALLSATEGGRPVSLRRFEQDGYPFVEDYVRTASGDSARIATNLFLPNAWSGGSTGGRYELSFVGQTTIRPIDLRVVIHPPDGMAFTSASGGLRPTGEDLVYQGSPRGNLDLEATFAPSIPLRIWRTITNATP